MVFTLAERTGIAQNLLVLCGLQSEHWNEPFVISSLLSARLDPRAPSGCFGAILIDEDDLARIHLSMKGPSPHINRRLAHELAHLALKLAGFESGHDEGETDAIAANLMIPPAGMRWAIRRFGYNLDAICEYFYGVPTEWILRRLAEVGEVLVLAHWLYHGHYAFGPEDLAGLDPQGCAKALREVFVGQRMFGVKSWEGDRGDGQWRAVIVERDALPMLFARKVG